MQTPQSDYALQLAQQAAALGEQQYGWAQNAYDQSSALTAQQVDAFNANAGTAEAEAGNIWNQYQGQGEGEITDLFNQAGQYASQGRTAFNMGQAGGTAEQAGAASLANTKQNLQSYGIDPSSGMYGELEQAANTANAASTAGAENEAQVSTAATGRTLLGESVNAAQQMPGQAVNAINSAYQGIGGAENAELANENAGTAALSSADPFLNTAMSLKYPPIGNYSTSVGTSTSNSQPAPKSGGSSGGGGSGGGGGGGSGGGGGQYIGYGTDGSGPSEDQMYQAAEANADGYGDSVSYSGGDDSGGGDDFAQGGGVIPHSATTGGHVPQSASPSHGQQTDDIPARLNAEEFVVPRDVARWKGQEYFQKLIAQSRKALMDAQQSGAHATPGPSVAGQQPRFVSHNLGGAI
jgi:hypothetical protein